MKDKNYWRKWFKAAGIRALKTFAQTLSATISTAVVLGDVNWKTALSAATLAGLLSLIMSFATGLPEVKFEDITTEEDLK